ncbi:MAG: LTA synthase family protein [Flavobacteriales bacterium]
MIFYVFHASFFSGNVLPTFWQGLRFDAVAISYVYALFVLFSILPFGFRSTKWYQNLLRFCFFLGTLLMCIFNLFDVAFFGFTAKRSTGDIFDFAQQNDEISNLIPTFIADFWHLFVLMFVLMFLARWLYKKTLINYKKASFSWKDFGFRMVTFLLGFAMLFLAARGGLELKPININEAARYVEPNHVPLVLNTPFTVFKTYFQKNLKPLQYFEDEEVEDLYKPEFTIKNQNETKLNVVVLILESFAKEYVGYFNPNRPYTPFLDSLFEQSLVYTDAYANGTQSIDAVPAIFNGFPDLMERPYILSAYSGNQTYGLANVLKNRGYNTSFYHGARTGSMGFDGFMKSAGIEHYSGMEDYPKVHLERDYDGKWGVYDEPYLQFYVDELNQKQEPFFSSLFTLSSHHPYTVPEQYDGQFPEGEHPIMELVAYSDHALRQFFKKAQKQAWFNNTLFVLVSDHTAQPVEEYYKHGLGKHAIPLAFYSPKLQLKGTDSTIVSQIDIMPIILETLGFSGTYFGFQNVDKAQNFVIIYQNGQFLYADDEYVASFDGKKINKLYKRFTEESIGELDLNNISDQSLVQRISTRCKATIQQVTNRFIRNQTLKKELKPAQ